MCWIFREKGGECYEEKIYYVSVWNAAIRVSGWMQFRQGTGW